VSTKTFGKKIKLRARENPTFMGAGTSLDPKKGAIIIMGNSLPKHRKKEEIKKSSGVSVLKIGWFKKKLVTASSSIARGYLHL
jgi:hypothetical protein